MTYPEVLWNHQKRGDFLRDLRSFCDSLDRYEIAFNFNNERGKHVYLVEKAYELTCQARDGAFPCPECEGTEFEVVEDNLGGKAVLGLACVSCETYGIVFPNGL